MDDGTVAVVLLEGEYSVVLELGFEYCLVIALYDRTGRQAIVESVKFSKEL